MVHLRSRIHTNFIAELGLKPVAGHSVPAAAVPAPLLLANALSLLVKIKHYTRKS